jgi:hypothetical protein
VTKTLRLQKVKNVKEKIRDSNGKRKETIEFLAIMSLPQLTIGSKKSDIRTFQLQSKMNKPGYQVLLHRFLLAAYPFREPNFLLYDTAMKPHTLFRNKQ